MPIPHLLLVQLFCLQVFVYGLGHLKMELLAILKVANMSLRKGGFGQPLILRMNSFTAVINRKLNNINVFVTTYMVWCLSLIITCSHGAV